ncbi:reverse transcriptase/maturase family protein [Lachnospiraceae bacterium 46-61]
MITLLRKKIKDERFLRLIRKFLNAGYLEDWKYHKTYSRTPQGGIISPILANIYLDELDKYIKSYAEKFNIGKERKRNSEYRKLEVQRGKLVRKLKSFTDKEQKQEIIKQIKLLEQKRRYVPYSEAMDKNYKRLQYTRYVDDFLIDVIGSKADCETIKKDVKNFLIEQLKLELSEEKTLITHAQKAAKFLGCDIYIRKSNLPKRDKIGRMVRNYGSRVV